MISIWSMTNNDNTANILYKAKGKRTCISTRPIYNWSCTGTKHCRYNQRWANNFISARSSTSINCLFGPTIIGLSFWNCFIYAWNNMTHYICGRWFHLFWEQNCCSSRLFHKRPMVDWTWWRHHMEKLSASCGKPPVIGGFARQGSIMWRYSF